MPRSACFVKRLTTLLSLILLPTALTSAQLPLQVPAEIGTAIAIAKLGDDKNTGKQPPSKKKRAVKKNKKQKKNNTKKQNTRKKKARGNSPLTPIVDKPNLPRVLLIGDSISIGYTLPVRKKLSDKVNVHRPATNCGPTTKGLAALDDWLGNSKWDVIHFNWGLHDLKYMGPNGENLQDPKLPTSRQQVPPQQYAANLRKLVQRLKKTKAELIWCHTTPVPVGAKGRVVGDADAYNKIAAKVMQDEGVTVHDLYRFCKPKLDDIQRKANVHFTAEGSQQLADQVAAAILRALQP